VRTPWQRSVRAALRATGRLVFAIGCLTSAQGTAQPPLPDYEVKAAFLYHFTQFVEWPLPNSNDPFFICIVNSSAISGSLEQLTQGKFVGSHPIRVTQVKNPGEVHACHVLFVGACSTTRLQQYLASAHDANLLTVGEQGEFLSAGGMVALFPQDQHIAFALDAEAIQRAHLSASSKLLRLARSPEEGFSARTYR